MRMVVMLAGLALFGAIALAVRYHFQSSGTGGRFVVLALASAANIFVFARALWLKAQALPRLWIALAMLSAAALLFAWTLQASRSARLKLIFDKDDPAFVLRAGPYRFVRHPFYAAYIVFWAGCAVATAEPVNIGYAVAIVPVLAWAAIGEERAFDGSPQAAAYAAYRKSAGLFWPKP